MLTLSRLVADLADGRTTSTELTEECLARIADASGEGERTFVEVHAEQARATAGAMDALRSAGAEPSPLAGVPVSVKDLFDVRGQVTRAGSRALSRAPATADAPAVAAWRRAGLVVLGRTNMTEFAYSGLGVNPHYGTPANPWAREQRRIPGGSSSGAAVSVADGMAHGALGSDTGGSCRIPAALCGLVGYKPTQSRVSRDGMVPLSPTLDAVGVVGRTVQCCALLSALLDPSRPGPSLSLARPPRLAVVRNYVFDGAEPAVTSAFDRAIGALRGAGAEIVDVEVAAFDALAEMNAGGGFPAAEAFAWHQDLIDAHGDEYDPRVLNRILRGERLTARDLIVLRARRERLVAGAAGTLSGVDAFLCPTAPLIAPPLDALDDEAEYGRVNLLMLRNPTVVNLLDGCAISVPMHRPGEPPTGLMVCGLRDTDDAVLRVAAWIEEHL